MTTTSASGSSGWISSARDTPAAAPSPGPRGAAPRPGRLQAQTPEGTPLYWEDAVYGQAELGEDGYPRKAGQRIFTTTAVTDWPVYVYRYAELDGDKPLYRYYKTSHTDSFLSVSTGKGSVRLESDEFFSTAKQFSGHLLFLYRILGMLFKSPFTCYLFGFWQ